MFRICDLSMYTHTLFESENKWQKNNQNRLPRESNESRQKIVKKPIERLN